MSEKYAVRNIRLCEKDCLCLYVCPTGATDTENSIIDISKCIGCGVCAESCPSGAISMMPRQLPPQQKKSEAVISALNALIKSKIQQEEIARNLPGILGTVMEKSNRLMAEDLNREAGYMLPQSNNTRELLLSLKDAELAGDFPKEAVTRLLKLIEFNEAETVNEKWRCPVCGYIHEGPLPEDFECPMCKEPGSSFIRVEE